MCTKFGWNRSRRSRVMLLYIYKVFIHVVTCVPSLVEIAPGVPELCWNVHTHMHPFLFYTHTRTRTRARARFLYIHIDICVPSMIEITPELRLSGVIYHQIPQSPETQKFRYFTVMWHHSWSVLLTYLNRNGRTFVCSSTTHTIELLLRYRFA
jgi:hypothetical protein